MEITVDADPTMTRPMTQRRPTSTRRSVDAEICRPAMWMPVSLDDFETADDERLTGRGIAVPAVAVAVGGVTIASRPTHARAPQHGPTPVAPPKSLAPRARSGGGSCEFRHGQK